MRAVASQAGRAWPTCAGTRRSRRAERMEAPEACSGGCGAAPRAGRGRLPTWDVVHRLRRWPHSTRWATTKGCGWTERPEQFVRRALGRALFEEGPFHRSLSSADPTLDVRSSSSRDQGPGDGRRARLAPLRALRRRGAPVERNGHQCRGLPPEGEPFGRLRRGSVGGPRGRRGASEVAPTWASRMPTWS